MGFGEKRAVTPLAVGLELLKPAQGSLGGPSTGVAGDRQGWGSHLGPEASFAVLGLAGGVQDPCRGQDPVGMGQEGWKPIEAHPKCQEKFTAKAGSCRRAGAPLPLAAPPHAYSYVFMSVRLQTVQL